MDPFAQVADKPARKGRSEERGRNENAVVERPVREFLNVDNFECKIAGFEHFEREANVTIRR